MRLKSILFVHSFSIMAEENILDDLLSQQHEEEHDMMFNDEAEDGAKSQGDNGSNHGHSDISDAELCQSKDETTIQGEDISDEEDKDEPEADSEPDDHISPKDKTKSSSGHGEDEPRHDEASKEEETTRRTETKMRERKRPPASRVSRKVSPPPSKESAVKKKGKSYDFATKLNYLFRDARFFLVKSNNLENVDLAKAKGVWSTPPANEARYGEDHVVAFARIFIDTNLFHFQFQPGV